jgi:hypothetical protein
LHGTACRRNPVEGVDFTEPDGNEINSVTSQLITIMTVGGGS